MCINERELLYFFSTVTQSLAAILGISIIIVSYINEKNKYLLNRLADLASEYWKSQNWGTSELRNIGIVSQERILEFLDREEQHIQKKKPDLYKKIKEIRDKYDAQPKLVMSSLYIAFVSAIVGMSLSSFGILKAYEWNNTLFGKLYVYFVFLCFLTTIILVSFLVSKAILPVIITKKTKIN